MPPRRFLKLGGGLAQARSGFAERIPARGPVQAETTALLAAMSVQPDENRKYLIDKTIGDLKSAGLWTTFDFFLMFAAHDQQAARVGWINPARIASNNGATVFTTNRGYAGDGTAAYLGLGTALNALVKFTQNNCSIGACIQNNLAQSGTVIGLLTTPQRLTLQPRTSIDQFATRLMGTTLSAAIGSVDSRGHWHLTRSSSAGYDRYKDGVLVDTITVASSTMLAEEVCFLRNGAQYSSGQILGAVHGGSSLTPAQISTLTAIIANYMMGVGA